jgi:putative thioredoxin
MNHDLTDFQTDVIERSQRVPVLVDFWAAWCGPCKMLGPVLEKLAAEAAGKWELVKIDTEAHPELAEQFQIRGIPDVRLFHHGTEVARFSGALPEPHLRQWLAENLPTPKRETMARARSFMQAGKAAEAAALLSPLAATDPGDDELAVLLARAMVFQDPKAAEQSVARIGAGSAWSGDAENVRAIAAAFTAPASLKSQPLGADYQSAIAHLRRGDFDAGLARLTELLQEKPGFDDGRAKALCLAVFRHLGMRHATTEKHIRAYSMAVNA